MTPSQRLARIESWSSTDPRTERDLEAIRRQMSRLEGQLLRVARRRSSWTAQGPLSLVLDEDGQDGS